VPVDTGCAKSKASIEKHPETVRNSGERSITPFVDHTTACNIYHHEAVKPGNAERTNKKCAATTGVIANAAGKDPPQFYPGDGRTLFVGLEWKQ
jgi:hypothetical protein